MKRVNAFVMKASLVAIGLSSLIAIENATAAQTSEQVYSISLATDGISGGVEIKNTAVNKHVNSLKIEPTQQNVSISLASWVSCAEPPYAQQSYLNDKETKMYFGTVNILGNGVIGVNSLYEKKYNTSFAYWPAKGVSNFSEKKTVQVNQSPFVVPLSAIKTGHPLVRFDPVEIFNQKMQQFVNGGGDKIEFLKKDHSYSVNRTISIGAQCYFSNHPNTTYGGAFESISVPLTVNYKGDPAINDTPVINAQLSNGNMANQINNDLPIHLDKAEFQPNMPTYVGKCLPDDNQKIQINLQFSGNGAGYMDLKVVPVSNTYADYGIYQSFNSIPVNAQATKKIDFSFPLKTMLQQEKYSYMAISNNKTWNHNMKIQGRYKTKDDDSQWSQWKDMDTAIFKHRCIPQLTVPLGGNGGKLNFDNDGGTQPLEFKPVQSTPKPLGKLAPLPTPTPKPLGKAAPMPAPSPAPLTIKKSEPEPTPALRLKSN